MKPTTTTGKGNSQFVIGAILLATIPLALFGTPFTDITVSNSGEFGSAGILGSSASGSVTIGYGNTPNYNSLAVGSFLIAGNSDMVVAGRWNDSSIGSSPFVVGIGTGSGNKKNAFEVHYDGTVIVNEQQGDVQMGIFGQ